ncbi:UvrD-helicase domain-containing protein [Lactococcus lactis]|uniref:UvrD-helicase domain-containing protein n=1 Tax=Lactococcus lactis TaxID=1358 RepID=UPI003D0B51CA
MNLTANQQKIIDTSGNLIVSASAGTGKTHTMVTKISHELTNHKSHRVIAAITFTIKAAREIKDRISVNTVGSFIGTNNSFVIEEVIKPFIKDVFGSKYGCDITTDYSLKFNKFDDGLAYIMYNGTLGSYLDSNKNFIFELALKILKRSEVARLYLQAKYFKIYIDEYQDCDSTMSEFFMYLTDVLEIALFIVGDDKQSLYIWRGADPESFRKIINKESFTHIFMSENFRSNKQIQNYSNLLFTETASLYEPYNNLSSIVLLNCTSSDWGDKIKEILDENSSSALLRTRNKDAEATSSILGDDEILFKYIPSLPIDTISNDSAWLYQSIAQYIFLDTYSVYDFIYNIPMGTEDDSNLKRKLENYLTKITLNQSDKKIFLEKVSDLAQFLGYNPQPKDLMLLYETISDFTYADAFEQEKYKHRAMTCHSSKGLQFEQVIIFAEDFPLRNDDDFYKHYVAVTRAKRKLIIVDTNSYWAQKYKKKLSLEFAKYNLRIEDLLQIC